MSQTDAMLDFCCETGRELLRNSAEIYRVEESIDKILQAYGYKTTEIFAIPSYIAVNIIENGETHSKFVRIKSTVNDMDKLNRINDLCHRVCRETPPPAQALRELRAITARPAYPPLLSYAAYGTVAGFFTLFWGGGLFDAGIAFICGLLVKLIVNKVAVGGANVFFRNLLTGAALSFLPVLLGKLGLAVNPDKIIIGTIMLLVPGISMTNVMRDFLSEDFLTAIIRLTEVIIVGIGLAIGIAIPITGLSLLFSVL